MKSMLRRVIRRGGSASRGDNDLDAPLRVARLSRVYRIVRFPVRRDIQVSFVDVDQEGTLREEVVEEANVDGVLF